MDKRELQLKISKVIGDVFEELDEPLVLGISFTVGVYVADDFTAMSGGVVVRSDVDAASFSKLTRMYFTQMHDDEPMEETRMFRKGTSVN